MREVTIRLAGLDYAIIITYLLSVVTLGVWIGYRRRASDDLFLGDRSFRWPAVGLSIWGTNIGPTFLIASCAAAYSTGMAAANFEWYAWVFMMLLAMVFLPHYAATRITTMPEFVKRRFGEPASRFLAWYVLLTTLVMWLGGMLYAGGVLTSQLLGCSITRSVILLMVVAMSFTVLGGFAAVVVTDSFQTILMILGSAVLVVLGLIEAGGPARLLAEIPPDYWRLLRPAGDPDFPWPAILLGYPVLGVWFWCTDQTIVQRVLGARDLRQGQLGALFAAFLKILPPFLFMLPGLICHLLHPGLSDPDRAFMTMVSQHMPTGLTGMVVAVMMAALISTLTSGMNSFSTIFTLDIYVKQFRPGASPRQIKRIGRFVTAGVAALSVGIAIFMQTFAKDMFSLFQSLIALFAPPMATVFLVGILWRRATATAARVVLTAGSALSVGLGYCQMKDIPVLWIRTWPHFLLYSFYMFVFLTLTMIALSLATNHSPGEERLPRLRDAQRTHGAHGGRIWIAWGVLAVIMAGLYIGFETLARWAAR